VGWRRAGRGAHPTRRSYADRAGRGS
jgi:hypothetical protein